MICRNAKAFSLARLEMNECSSYPLKFQKQLKQQKQSLHRAHNTAVRHGFRSADHMQHILLFLTKCYVLLASSCCDPFYSSFYSFTRHADSAQKAQAGAYRGNQVTCLIRYGSTRCGKRAYLCKILCLAYRGNQTLHVIRYFATRHAQKAYLCKSLVLLLMPSAFLAEPNMEAMTPFDLLLLGAAPVGGS